MIEVLLILDLVLKNKDFGTYNEHVERSKTRTCDLYTTPKACAFTHFDITGLQKAH
jgi:hypothetical protein